MAREFLKNAVNALTKTKKRKAWLGAAGALACLVLVCTLVATLLPAQTLTEQTYCNIEAHIHGAECYDRGLVCPQSVAAAHEHTDACKGNVLVCGQEEAAEHAAHAYTCGTLICAEEHTHEEGCYDASVLTCGFHIHADSCYEESYVCEESKVTDVDTHVHVESCYSSVAVLVCTKAEHTHTLICYSDPAYGVETEEQWAADIPALTGVAADDLVAVAKSQLAAEYKESEFNYTVMSNGVTKKGYTRYGHWAGDRYMDWNMAFAGFCLDYANLDHIPFDTNYNQWISKLKEASLYVSEPHMPKVGEIIFFYYGEYSAGIITSVNDDGTVTVIMGDHKENMVRENRVSTYSAYGYCLLEPVETGESSGSVSGMYNGLLWKLEEDETGSMVLDISGKGKIPDYTSHWSRYRGVVERIVIHGEVTEIGSSAFAYFDALEKVEIGGNVTIVGRDSFEYCPRLTEVILHDGVEIVYAEAFNNCDALKTVILPNSLKLIGGWAFYDCDGLESITIPGSVNEWYTHIFKDCDNLKEVVIGSGVKEIRESTFESCESLVSVTIPDTVETIEKNAFHSCGLQSVTIPSGVKTVGDYAFSHNPITGELTVPNTVTSWGAEAFSYCTIESVIIQEGVTEIPTSMFMGCRNLTSVTIPESVSFIRSGAFSKTGLTSVTIPANVVFGAGVYQDCQSLETVTIDDGVTTITNQMFYDCTALTSVTIPDSVTSIDYRAFQNCTALTSVTVPDSVSSIGSEVFKGCTALSSLEIPGSVHSIGSGAFSDCTSLRDPFKPNTFYTFAEGDANNTGLPKMLSDLTGNWYVDENGVLYQLMSDNEAKLTYIPSNLTTYNVLATIPGQEEDISYTVTAVATDSLALADSLTELTFADSSKITSIETKAFGNCATLTKINGYATWGAARKTFQNEKLVVGEDPCYNTKLVQNYNTSGGELTDTSFSVESSVVDGTWFNLETKVTSTEYSPAKEGKIWCCYTGETAMTRIFVNQSSTDYRLRVYVEFSGKNGFTDLSDQLNKTQNAAQGKAKVTFRQSNDPNVYYFELEPQGDGDTFEYTFDTGYTNEGAGGSARIWGAVLTKEEAKDIGSGVVPANYYHEVQWKKNPDEHTISVASNTGELKADGTEENVIRVSELEYTISVGNNRIGNDENQNAKDEEPKGMDPVVKTTFKTTLVLPEYLQVNPKYKDAIANGTIDMTTYANSVYVNNEKVFNVSVSVDVENLYLDANGDPVVEWSCLSEPTEDIEIRFYNLLVVDKSYFADIQNQYIVVDHKTEMTVHYAYSEPAIYNATTNTTMQATSDFQLAANSDYAYYWGESFVRRIYAKNDGVCAYGSLYSIQETLDNWLYLSPDSIAEILAGTYGERTVIKINAAQLCYPPSGEAASVTAVDGKTIVQLDVQNTGKNTEYYGNETDEASGCINDESVTIQFTMVNGMVQIAVDNDRNGTVENTYEVENTSSAIDAKLNEIGYVPTRSDYYTIEVTLVANEEEPLIVYGNQTLELFSYTGRMKDTFMILTVDEHQPELNSAYRREYTQTVAYNKYGTSIKTQTVQLSKSYRDYSLTRAVRALKGGQWNETTQAQPGEIVKQEITFSHRGVGRRDVLPLVESVGAPQYVLVPVTEENSSLADKELTTITFQGTDYYVLNKPGEYGGLWIGGYYAESVTVSKTDTQIRWYFTNLTGSYTQRVEYLIRVDVTEPGYTCSSEAWLGDHQPHRLWVSRGTIYIPSVSTDAKIVVNRGSVPGNDELIRQSTLSAGEQVTYRYSLTEHNQVGLTISGDQVYATLPKIVPPSTADSWRWSKENVSIWYVTDKSSVKITNPDSWRITNIPANSNHPAADQYYIYWGDDFQIDFVDGGTVYIYVTVTFPDGEDWSSYRASYGDDILKNAFYLYKAAKEVTHTLQIPAEAWLQTGVYSTYIPQTAENQMQAMSRLFYQNDSEVMYYVALYNGGDSRLYLSNIYMNQPAGFTFKGLYGENYSTAENHYLYMDAYQLQNSYAYRFLDIPNGDGRQYTPKNFTVLGGHYTNYSSFQIYNYRSGDNLSYDESSKKYYLKPGEYVAFGVKFSIAAPASTEDLAAFKVYMHYDNYNDGGVEAAEGVSISARKNSMFNNDGTCRIETVESTGSQKLTSEVKLERGDMLPGISIKPVKVISGQSTPESYDTHADPKDTIEWETTISNEGLYPMYGYTVSVKMEAPYAFVSDLRWEGGSCTMDSWSPETDSALIHVYSGGTRYNLTLDGGAINISNATLSISSEVVDGVKTGNLILTIQVKNARIPAGSSHTLTFRTKNFSDTETDGIYLCEARVTPMANQEYDGDKVVYGYNVTDEMGNDLGVENYSQVYITTDSSTSSEMKVSDGVNTAPKKDGTRYITLGNEDAAINYTLTVNNENNEGMRKLVIINTLPDVNDHGPFSEMHKRNSQFQISLAEDPAFKVQLTGVSDDPAYTIEYTTATTFDANDWAGGADAKWSTELPENEAERNAIRAFRVVLLSKHDTAIIPPNTQVTVSYQAKITGDVEPGEMAWNSFGYQFLSVGHPVERRAAPLSVGVQIPNVPTIVKELVYSNGEAFIAEKDETATFLITSASGDNTCVTVTVPKGSSSSRQVSLATLKKYQQVDGKWTETDTNWNWVEGATYTVKEIACSDGFFFEDFNNRPGNETYTFTYKAAQKSKIVCTNYTKDWSIKLFKTGSDVTNIGLQGAVFGFYSPDAKDAMSTDAIAAARTAASLAEDVTIPTEVKAEDGTVYYLADIVVTDIYGAYRWSKLLEDSYALVELRAPKGYNLDSTVHQVTKVDDGVAEVTITNVSGYELPVTGGAGTDLYSTIGTVLMLIGLCGAYMLLQKRRGWAAEG